MSVRTTADEKKEVAKNSTRSATKALAEILIFECDGYDELSDTTKIKLIRAFDMLRNAHAELKD